MLTVEMINPSEVTLAGRFDASQVRVAEPVLDALQGDSVLNCKQLDYISSAGIGVVLATYKRLHSQGSSLRMTHANEHIRQVFRYAGLDKIISVESASTSN